MASSSDVPSGDGNGKRPVWNVPSNDSIDVSPVMDTNSWPALSESTKASPKSSSESLKSLSDGSTSGPSVPIPSAKQSIVDPTPTPLPNPTTGSPARQKSMKRGGGGSSSSSNGVAALPLPPAISTETSQASEPSPRGVPRSSGPSLQPHVAGSDQHRSYGSGRRGNNGGGTQNSYGSRRNQEWPHQQNFYMQHRGGGRSYPRAPVSVTAPYVGPPPPVRPYVMNPMGFPEMPYPVVYVAPPPPPESLRVVPPYLMDPQRVQLLKQIEYYFSSENLCKDLYLRRNMDEEGWVPVTLIARFNRVMLLTNNAQYILDTVRMSTAVEVQGEKIRRRNDWMQWLLPPSASGSPSSTAEDYDAVVTRLQTVGIEETAAEHNSMGGPTPTDAVLTRSASVNLNGQVHVVGDPAGEGNVQLTGLTASDRYRSMRSLARSDTL